MDSRNEWAILIGMSESWPDEITARIAAEIKRLRGDRTGQWLSDRTADLGHRVSRSTISEIETKRRKSITVADLIILAAALDTVPVALVFPGPYNEDVRVLPMLQVPQIWAAQWFSGELRPTSEVPFDDKGHYVQIPHPEAYDANVERLQDARDAAKAYDKKASLWRELNRLRSAKNSGNEGISEQQITELVHVIGEIQQQIDHHLDPQLRARAAREQFERELYGG
jgi:hypothetical protein